MGRLALWIDLHIAHPLCWDRYVPGLGWLAFHYCQWAAAKYDGPWWDVEG